MFQPRLVRTLPLLLLLAACVDDPTTAVREPEPGPTARIVGAYKFTITGLGTDDVRASVAPVPSGAAQTLIPANESSLGFELVSASRMTHGVRGQGGHRYMSITYRVRNGTGAAVTNLMLMPMMESGTIPGTHLSSVLLADGTQADSAVARLFVPTGAVTLGDDGGLQSTLTDVLQVVEESEVAEITPPAGVTRIFPYGYVVRNPSTPASRTLPATTDANQFDGVVTFAFRYPLQPSSSADPYTMTIHALAVEDTETRVTESIEEAHDTAAVRRVRERAAALGATTVTVLAGSGALDPAVEDYPGQRQICSVRTAGTAGSPLTYITQPGGYAKILVLRPGESVDPCAANYRTGTPGRPAYGVPFPLTVKAMDLYGNVRTAQVDSVRLEQVSGPTVTVGPRAALVSGSATINVTYFNFGESLLRAVGRRHRGAQALNVAGITRVWNGNVSTNPSDVNNWDIGYYTGVQDTAYFPAGRPNYPVLTASANIGGVILEEGASISLGAFDLTASSLVWAGTTGGITSTTGRLILTGTGTTIKGNLPRMQVTGSYSLAGPVVSRARVETLGGRLRTVGHRLQTTSN